MISKRGVLIVKDPPGPTSLVSGVLGMNGIRECYNDLLDKMGRHFSKQL